MRPGLLEDERRCAEALNEVGVTGVWGPGEGHPLSECFNQWGVYMGSHGGHGDRLIEAMRRCVACCGIGKYWRMDYGKGPLMRDVFDRISRQYLGCPL